MNFLTATQSTMFLIKYIAWPLGKVMDWIYEFLAAIGIPNIGGAVILFTVVVKALLIPMSIKQQKTSRLQAVMQPELQAIQAKYKGKSGDQAAMMQQQAEMKAVYEKYGTSMTGGCLQILIQMPIFFALYQVIVKLPGYVTRVKNIFLPLAEKISEGNLWNWENVNAEQYTNGVVDVLYQYKPGDWAKFKEQQEALYNTYYPTMQPQIAQAMTFLGIDLTQTPWELVTSGECWWAVFIPIFAGVFQWLTTKLATVGQPKKQDDSNPLGGSMQIMNLLFPIISVVFCFMFSGALGIYWVASALVQLLIQLVVNLYLNKVDLNEMVKKNVEKMNKKRIRRGQKPIRVQDVSMTVQNLEEEKKAAAAYKETVKATSEESTEYYNRTTSAKPGSLAAKAGMVQQYEERQKALKAGKKTPAEPESEKE